MTGSDYEKHVTKFVRTLNFGIPPIISNNRKFKGKTQPGEYEIDISVELMFSDAIHFLMIIECKHWKRRVDRPVIQNLIQTKDAISADKAVAVSSKGFSREAIAVAKDRSIALWEIDPIRDKHTMVCYSLPRDNFHSYDLYYELQSQFLSAVGINEPRFGIDHDMNLLIGDVYTGITCFKDWHKIDSLKSLAQWEDSSIQKIIGFRNSVIEKRFPPLIANILKLADRLLLRNIFIYNIFKAIASDNIPGYIKFMNYRIFPPYY
jgi:restriction endonuclease